MLRHIVVALLAACLSHQVAAAEPIRVLASIKPVQLIAADIVGDMGSVELLVKPGASVHHYAMKPSDLRKLNEADLVVWVGPELELFLEKSLRSVQVPVVAMDDGAEGHDEADEDGREQDHDRGHHSGGDHHHHHDHDPHLWLDPARADQLALALAQALSQRYPAQQAQIMQNYTRFHEALEHSAHALEQQLMPLQDKGFFVFHDAWNHFVGHFGLTQLGYFTVDPGRKPGARHLAQIRQQLEQTPGVCVFTEPQFEPALIGVIVQGTGARVGELDPLASAIAPGENGYIRFLQDAAARFERCLHAPLN